MKAFQRLGLLFFLAVGVTVTHSSVLGVENEGGPQEEISIAHIAEGIRQHIAEESRAHDGHFVLEHEGESLRLKLIRIHMEYLADLGEGVQFACVDLVEQDGTVYDVDFFLAGTEPADLRVTETNIHKLDGLPLYVWEQLEDDTWQRVAPEEATEEMLGVIRGEDRFEFIYRYAIPELDGPARLWLPFARSDDSQTVSVKDIRAPAPWRLLDESRHGNQVLFMELGPEAGGSEVEIRYQVNRKEVSPYAGHPSESLAGFLEAENLVPINDTFRDIAREVTREADTDLMRARELYKHAAAEIRYAKVGDGWGQGDAVYACDIKKGNCTDFHSYFIALARAAGIPARFIIGAALPSERDDGGVDGYHCWAEFYAEGKWWPVDISEANKHPMLADYYFGRHPANRFELSRGRDLVFDPAPVSGPVNFLAYPVLEVNGAEINARPVFEFRRLREPSVQARAAQTTEVLSIERPGASS